MPVSLIATRFRGTVCNGAQCERAQGEPLGAQPSREGTQPRSPSQIHLRFTCRLFPRGNIYQGKAASVAAHQHKVHPWEGKSFLHKLGRPLQKTLRSNRYGVCHSAATFTPTSAGTRVGAIEHAQRPYLRILMDWVASPLRETQPRLSTPAAKSSNQSETSIQSGLLPWGIEDMGPMLDTEDGTTLARMSICTAKAVRQEHRMPFPHSLRHALFIFCEAHNALRQLQQVIPPTRPLPLTSRELPSFSISPCIFYSRRIDAAAGRAAIKSTQEENCGLH